MTSLRLFRARRMLAIPLLSLLASGCAGLGGNVAGSFSCRAPTGDCAPSHVIDARATDELGRTPAPTYDAARKRAGITGSDAARTTERTIRIVFPAHVDEAGVLHDESVAWAVVERPQWTGTLRAQDRADQPSAMRTMRRQLKNAQARGVAAPPKGQDDPAAMPGEASLAESLAPIADEHAALRALDAMPGLTVDIASPNDTSPFQLASPLPLPSSVAEAMPGAPAPAAGGSDLTSAPQGSGPPAIH